MNHREVTVGNKAIGYALFVLILVSGLAWNLVVVAQSQDAQQANITLDDDGISIDEDEISARRGQAIVYRVENDTDEEKTVQLTNFRIGTREEGQCVPGDESSDPLNGNQDATVPANATRTITVTVKPDADIGCYKYDIEATDLDTLDPVLDIDR